MREAVPHRLLSTSFRCPSGGGGLVVVGKREGEGEREIVYKSDLTSLPPLPARFV